MVPATDLYNIIGFHPAGVTPTSAIKLKLNELEKYSNYIDYIDVCS